MKEFKVGDKVYVECSVINTNNGHIYPIIVSTEENMELSFTKDGRFQNSDSISVLKHIEDITPKPEFPKWMMVFTGSEWLKRKVIYKDEFGYVFICNEAETLEYDNVNSCKYAKEIEPENTKLQELEIKYKELGEELEKLKK